MYIHNNIKNGNTSIEKIEENGEQFKSDLNMKQEITRGNPKYKSKVQLNTIENINKEKEVIKLYDDYAKIKSKAMYKKQNREQDLKY